MINEENEQKDTARGGQDVKNPEIRYVPLDIRTLVEDDDELDFVEVFRTFWAGRTAIIKSMAVFFMLGLLVAFLSVEEYTSEVKLLPELQEASSLGSLGGLAERFGFSTGTQSMSEGIPSNLYPDIIRSNVFLLELMKYEVVIPDSRQEVTLVEYIENYQKGSIFRKIIRLPFTFRDWLLRSNDSEDTSLDKETGRHEKLDHLVTMSDEDWNTLRKIRGRINTNQNSETGVVTISVKMQNSVVAADVVDEVVQLLSDYITEYRTEKARRDLEFIEDQFKNAKSRFEEAQQELAEFNDQNRGQLTALTRTEEQLLQSRYNLNFNLYNSMAERLEQARIKLQEDTPVVNILEPAAIPDQRSQPNRILILIAFTIIGAIIGIGTIFVMPFYKNIKAELNP